MRYISRAIQHSSHTHTKIDRFFTEFIELIDLYGAATKADDKQLTVRLALVFEEGETKEQKENEKIWLEL